MIVLIVLLLLSLFTWLGLVGFALSDDPELPEMPDTEIDPAQFPGLSKDALDDTTEPSPDFQWSQ